MADHATVVVPQPANDELRDQPTSANHTQFLENYSKFIKFNHPTENGRLVKNLDTLPMADYQDLRGRIVDLLSTVGTANFFLLCATGLTIAEIVLAGFDHNYLWITLAVIKFCMTIIMYPILNRNGFWLDMLPVIVAISVFEVIIFNTRTEYHPGVLYTGLFKTFFIISFLSLIFMALSYGLLRHVHNLNSIIHNDYQMLARRVMEQRMMAKWDHSRRFSLSAKRGSISSVSGEHDVPMRNGDYEALEHHV
jgi:hypothetical protein